MTEDFDWALIAKYLDRTCTPAEREAVDAWIHSDASHAAEFAAINKAWSDARLIPSRPRLDSMWAELAGTIRSRDLHVVAPSDRNPTAARSASRRKVLSLSRHRTRNPRARAIAIALATIAAAAAVGVFALRPAMRHNAPAADTYRQYATARGQRATIQLSDGSEIILAAASRIKIPVRFGESSREVLLDGEAVFNVVHDATRPFRVRAKNGVMEDVGTRFDVSAYADDSVLAVAVEEGAVAVSAARAGSAETVLRRGDVGRLSRNDQLVLAKGVNAAEYSEWTAARVTFTRAALSEVVTTLARWYDLDIRVTDSALAREKVTATVSLEDSNEMLQLLSVALGAHAKRDGRIVKLERGQ